jgi:hypothetical protein
VIKEFSPLASIIIMLRNPIDVMYSMYYLRRFSNLEDQPSFGAALDADASGRNLTGLTYRERVNFAAQVERYITVFGREKVHFIVYDDFKIDTRKFSRIHCASSVCAATPKRIFLGLTAIGALERGFCGVLFGTPQWLCGGLSSLSHRDGFGQPLGASPAIEYHRGASTTDGI